EGATVAEIVGTLERTYPRLSGWIRDEHGGVRPHVHLFLNGERAELGQTIDASDRLHVLPAISGGALGTAVAEEEELLATDPAEEEELLVGTRLECDARHRTRRRVGGRGARGVVPERRQRADLGAQSWPVERAQPQGLGAGRRRHVPQLDLPLARRSGQVAGGDLGCGRVG